MGVVAVSPGERQHIR